MITCVTIAAGTPQTGVIKVLRLLAAAVGDYIWHSLTHTLVRLQLQSHAELVYN